MRWAVAIGKDAAKAGTRALDSLREAGVDSYRLPNAGADVLALAAGQAHLDGDAVLTVGGDGTINLVVNGLLASGSTTIPRMGIVPAGTGSDLARMFAISSSVEDAVQKAVDGDDYRADVMEISGDFGVRHGLNVFEAGLGAATVRHADRMPRWTGPIKYEMAFWAALPTFRPGSFSLQVDDRTIEGKGLVIVAANGEFFGGGMRIAPKASIVDGRFDMIVVDAPKREAFTLFPRMKQGLHLTHPGVRRVLTSWFRLTTEPEWPTEVDGEFLGGTPVEGRIIPGAVDIRV